MRVNDEHQRLAKEYMNSPIARILIALGYEGKFDAWWSSYDVVPLTDGLNGAFALLDQLYEDYALEYNLFRDNDGSHTCEIGFWHGMDRPQVWMGGADNPHDAILDAILKCPIVMGDKAESDENR